MDASDIRPIGVFDSGVGGLSVLKELVKLMPKENYIFVADQINVPYGEKSKKELEKETLKICGFLVSKNAKVVVIACNTATCYAIDFLRTNIKTPIVGTVPAVKPAIGKTKAGVIAVMSTPATSKSIYLKNLIKDCADGARVLNIGCPDLENTVETGMLNSLKVRHLLLKYTKPIKKAGADVVVLGCTHYPFLKSQIKKFLGNNVEIIDSGKAIAKRTKEVIQQMGAFNGCGDRTDFYTTGNSAQFSKVASSLMKRPIKTKHISLL